MADRVCLGAVSGAFGVNGDVRLKSFCANPAAIGDYGALTSEDGKSSFEISALKPIKAGFSARLSGIATRDQAEGLKGTRLYAPRDVLPDLPDDEYYHADLIGLLALDTGGAEIGRVKAVVNHGADDLLEIHVAGGGTALVPFLQAIVPTVDIAGGRLIVDPPDGLLSDDG
jgi:16S rRNA processing protein RimM